MSLNTRKRPRDETNWDQIIDNGVIYPHPKSTVQTLWEWINDHGSLLDEIRNSQLDELLGRTRSVRDRKETEKRYRKPKGVSVTNA